MAPLYVVFRVLVVFINGTLWRDTCGVYNVSSVYGALGLNVSCGVYCVFYC